MDGSTRPVSTNRLDRQQVEVDLQTELFEKAIGSVGFQVLLLSAEFQTETPVT